MGIVQMVECMVYDPKFGCSILAQSIFNPLEIPPCIRVRAKLNELLLKAQLEAVMIWSIP